MLNSAGSLQQDGTSADNDGSEESISSDEERQLRSSLAALVTMSLAAAAAEAAPGADWAASPAAALLVAPSGANSAAAPAADPSSPTMGDRATSWQLPLPTELTQLVSLAPPLLAGGLSRSGVPAATVAAAVQSLSLACHRQLVRPPPARHQQLLQGGQRQDCCPRHCSPQQPTARQFLICAGRFAAALLSTPALSAVPGLLPLSSGNNSL